MRRVEHKAAQIAQTIDVRENVSKNIISADTRTGSPRGGIYL